MIRIFPAVHLPCSLRPAQRRRPDQSGRFT
nr:MAG TPA: hypothetical protein [Caudoviricetes sp.]